MTYFVATGETADAVPLPHLPSAVWILSSLEVSVRDRGVEYLLLTHPSYALPGAGDIPPAHDEGYWAPPFIAYPVATQYSPPTTVGSLRRVVHAALNRIDLERDLQHLCYQMGLRDVELIERPSFVEVKSSPRSPDSVKAYHILRYGLVSVDSVCVRNLADPEGWAGYVYFPIVDPEPHTHRRVSANGRAETWFLGKPLMSNVDHILASSDRRATLASRAIEVDASAFERSETGILLAADLSGYGRALGYAGQNMHTFHETGEAAQLQFRRGVNEELLGMLGDIGVTQAQVAGDGFLATMPERVYPDVSSTLTIVLNRWRRTLEVVHSLNATIREVDLRVGSRLAVHYGAYTYGRVGGARSFAPAFDGASIVHVARLEQGMASFAGASNSKIRVTSVNDIVCISGALSERFEQRFEPPAEWRYVRPVTVTAKEFTGEALLYRFGRR